MRAAEDHGARVAALHALAVHVEEHVEHLRVGNLVGGDKPGPNRAERVVALALVPLRGLHLEGALGDVVHHAIAGDVGERLVLRDMARGGADHDAEFALPVELGRVRRLDDVVVRAADRSGRLAEDDRLGGNGHASLFGVVRIVEADGHELPDAHVGHAHARVAGDDREGFGLDAREVLQPARRNLVRPDVADHLGQVAELAIRIDHARLLEAVLSITTKFH